MIIEKIPFEIDFPIKILTDKKINFEDKREREKIFKRNIYYCKYGKIKNPFLEKRNKVFFRLAKELVKFIKEKYPHQNILNVSIFGSSLYSKKPKDFDFLVILNRNIFSYSKTKLTIRENKRKVKYSIGISIKGIENFLRGIFDFESDVLLNLQSQIIYRTAVSLFRRHIPIIGHDFANNKEEFLKNGYAQVSDLLNNAYELYYLKNKKSDMSNARRSGKILSRIYEAICYMCFLNNDIKTKNLKKRISILIDKRATLQESKKVFNKVVLLYKKGIGHLNKNFRDKRKVLTVLLDESLKGNIRERLEDYWKYAKLPYQWINPILEILSKNYYDEDLAIKEIRKKFPSIPNKNSLNYSKKLENFRKRKVRNLANRIKNDISGKLIADVGGRTDDFIEQILFSKKDIKKAYVTDLCSFKEKSKNPKINFVVQSSSTKIPFIERTIDTIILSMVLHHLRKKQQEKMIKSIVSYLKNKGRIILIEDTYPIRAGLRMYDKITQEFLNFKSSEKKKILYFYDWFGNRLMRNRDNIPLFYNYKTMEEWKKTFEKHGMKQIKSEFIKKSKSNPDIFPPKAVMVFQKTES